MLTARRTDDPNQRPHRVVTRIRPEAPDDHAERVTPTRVIASNGRSSELPLQRLFLERRSSRAFAGEAISRRHIATLLEAARWAPSSFNEQPWRFVVASRDSARWNDFLSWLSESNRVWCERAAALVLVAARAGSGPRTPHDFDTGAAWAHLALQAAALGLIAHAVAGFDHERAADDLRIPFSFHAVCIVAIGVPGHADDLPERLRSREAASQRRPLQEIAFDSEWNRPFSWKGASR
jgi:nitroreductase